MGSHGDGSINITKNKYVNHCREGCECVVKEVT